MGDSHRPICSKSGVYVQIIIVALFAVFCLTSCERDENKSSARVPPSRPLSAEPDNQAERKPSPTTTESSRILESCGANSKRELLDGEGLVRALIQKLQPKLANLKVWHLGQLDFSSTEFSGASIGVQTIPPDPEENWLMIYYLGCDGERAYAEVFQFLRTNILELHHDHEGWRVLDHTSAAIGMSEPTTPKQWTSAALLDFAGRMFEKSRKSLQLADEELKKGPIW